MTAILNSSSIFLRHFITSILQNQDHHGLGVSQRDLVKAATVGYLDRVGRILLGIARVHGTRRLLVHLHGLAAMGNGP